MILREECPFVEDLTLTMQLMLGTAKNWWIAGKTSHKYLVKSKYKHKNNLFGRSYFIWFRKSHSSYVN